MGCMNVLSGYAKNRHQPQLTAINLLVLNLMPNRSETEHQIISVLKRTPYDFNLTFCRMATHQVKHFASGMLEKYVTFADIKEQHFDALLVTGAPIDQKQFTEIDYWEEFKEFVDWRKTHVTTSCFSCWSAWAAGTIDHVLVGETVPAKIYGVFTTNGITMPHSRYFKIPPKNVKIKVLASNQAIGTTVMWDDETQTYYVTGHFEYGTTTLANEYFRDVKKGLATDKPKNYFTKKQRPKNTWKSDATMFYRDWLRQIVSTKQNQFQKND